MATIKSFTSLEQSKVLAKILPLESADMSYRPYREEGGIPDYEATLCPFRYASWIGVPCWSLAALLDALPEGMIENYYAPNLQKENGKYSIAYGNEELLCVADNPIDAVFEMIIKLKELKML